MADEEKIAESTVVENDPARAEVSGVRRMCGEMEADPANEKIILVCKRIEDPEIHIDIWTLELIYDIERTPDGGARILMTFTSPLCPFGPQLMAQVKGDIEAAGITPVLVQVTFSPAWKPSEEVREMLGV